MARSGGRFWPRTLPALAPLPRRRTLPDVDDFYGPLSQYLNAALFTICGPGLIILVAANILILILILTLAYLLSRKAWGPVPALVSVGVFIILFTASQFGTHGNFNFITPYAEETTHGFLVCLVLAFVLVRWIENATRAGSFLAGLLFGLTLILKPEFMVGGAPLIAAAIPIRAWSGQPVRIVDLALMALGALAPTLVFVAFFAHSMSLPDSVGAAGRAWVNALTPNRFSNDALELRFIGLDHPWHNLLDEIVAPLEALVLFCGIGFAASYYEKKIDRPRAFFLAVGLPAVVLAGFSYRVIDWPESALALPGLLLLYLAFTGISFVRQPDTREYAPRLLLAVLALALLARMILHARFYSYGYYQASLAATLVPAILLFEAPSWFRLGPRGRRAFVVGLLALFLPCLVIMAKGSYYNLRLKTVPVGAGVDLFYSSKNDATGQMVDTVSSALRSEPPNSTLLVLPEGVMINFLARMPSPIAPYAYYTACTMGGQEDRIVTNLQSHPPDVVVIVSRPLLEFGIPRWGVDTDEGRQILSWVQQNYMIAFSRGGNPLDPDVRGVVVLTPRPGNATQSASLPSSLR